ncbi:hypothetical protein JB92DRAFT_2786475 [Gautieria morchelliformis]|nr:hypothetical protein JB92DRAFT_2786475 [Gautieria morchelliformis]
MSFHINHNVTLPAPPGNTHQSFNLLPDEIKFCQTTTSKLWRTPTSYAFVILRYSGVIATFPALFFTSIQSKHCLAAMVISQLGVVLVVAASGVIFSYRVFAVWAGRKFIYGIVGIVVYVAMLACWIAVASQYRIQTGPPTPFGSNCQIQPIVAWAPICNASSVLFDLVILILTISRIGHQRGSRVRYLIYRDGLIYFLFTTVMNIVVLVIQALGPSWALTKAAVLPFSTIITATMGVRVFLNLRLSINEMPVMPLVPDTIRAEMSDSCQSPEHPGIPMQTLVVTSEEGTSGKDPQGPFYYTRTPDDPGA